MRFSELPLKTVFRNKYGVRERRWFVKLTERHVMQVTEPQGYLHWSDPDVEVET